MIYLLLFWEFLKIGTFVVGGGMAALPFLFDLSERYSWFSAQELADMVAIAESTPGPLAINMATYVGYTTAGVTGSLFATIAVSLPSLLISLLVCRLLSLYSASEWVQHIFSGLRPAVAGLITVISFDLLELAVVTNIDLGWSSGLNYKSLILFAVLCFAVFRFKKHPLLYVAAGAVAGIILQL